MNDQQDSDAQAPADATPAREPVFNLPPVVLLLIGICAAVYGLEAYVLSEQAYFTLLLYGAFIPVRYSGQFDLDISAFTSIFTYAFLHGSITHLAVNMIWLAAFGSPLANRLGATKFLAFWALTSACAAGLHWVLHMSDQGPLVGASGAISGMMGAAARFGFHIDRSHGKAAFAGAPLPITVCLRSRTVVTFLSIWMLINLVTGLVRFTPGVDGQIAWEAHIGGFVAGFLGIDRFSRPPKRKELPPLDPPEEMDEADEAGRPT